MSPTRIALIHAMALLDGDLPPWGGLDMLLSTNPNHITAEWPPRGATPRAPAGAWSPA